MQENNDVVVKISDLPSQISKRSATFSSEGIYIKWEYKYTWSITLIDTPGLLFDEEGHCQDERSELVLDLVRPLHRRIVVVEEASAWDRVVMRVCTLLNPVH